MYCYGTSPQHECIKESHGKDKTRDPGRLQSTDETIPGRNDRKGLYLHHSFLSKKHRAELKRLGDEYRLTRAEASEHIFQTYLRSDDKYVTQTHNINTNQQSEIRAAIEALEARVKALEEMQTGKPEEQGQGQEISRSGVMPEIEDNDSVDLRPVNTTQETQTEIPVPVPEPKTESGSNLPDILEGIDPDNISIEGRNRLVLNLQEAYPGKKEAQSRVDILNTAGILFNGEPWTTKQFSDQRSMAKKRVKK